MKRQITFHNMESSQIIEKEANKKIDKIEELLKGSEWETPKYFELWLKSNPQHVHHIVEINLKTPQFDLNAQSKNADMYLALDEAFDKITKELKKQKSKLKDKKQKVETPKNEFSDDKYNL